MWGQGTVSLGGVEDDRYHYKGYGEFVCSGAKDFCSKVGMMVPFVIAAFAFTWFTLCVSGLAVLRIIEKCTSDQLQVAIFSACAAICMICAVALGATIDQSQILKEGGFGFAFYCAFGHIFMCVWITIVSVIGWRDGMKALATEEPI